MRATAPDRYLADTRGSGLYVQLEKALSERWSMGLGLSQVSLRDGGDNNYSFNSLDLIGRYWFKPWGPLNPFVQAGVGGNLFRDAFKNPWGDVLHTQIGLGSHYVLDTHWAIEYGLSYHTIAPFNTPHQYLATRLGVNYRYGTQPKVNRIAPPPMNVTEVATLSVERVRSVTGKLAYTVKPGDTLYDIAGRENTLRRPILWPLLYDENSDRIKNPHLIQPYQVLSIRRNYSPEEAEAARKVAAETLYQRPGTAQAQP